MASVDELKKLVSRLESRIEQLESKITGHGGAEKTEDGMRMIIMGPPGAGMDGLFLLLMG
jgi:adenylate kinase